MDGRHYGLSSVVRPEDEALRSIVEGTVSVTGARFFQSLVRHLAAALHVRCSLVTERLPESPTSVRLLAFWDGQVFQPPFDYAVEGHPCAEVLDQGMCHYPSAVRAAFPADPYLAAIGAESYLGLAMEDSEGRILGHVAVLDDRPMAADPQRLSNLRIFAARAGAELQRLRAERELHDRYEELKRLEASREGLAEMIVHDLRNPLVSVIGHLELLEQGPSRDDLGRESLRVVKRNAERLLAMVTDILDVSKLTAGRMPVRLAAFDLRPLIDEVLADLRPQLERKRLLAEVDVPPAIASAVADRELVRRILSNILGNAASFAPRGSALRLEVREAQADLRLAITDRGPGVPLLDRERIFDRFGATGAQGRGRRHSTGLGLAYCKLAVEAQGGRIGVDDAERGGSTFWFTLRRPLPDRLGLARVC